MTPRTVSTTAAAVVAGLVVLLLWGPRALAPLLLLAVAVAVVHHEVRPAPQRRLSAGGRPQPSAVVVLPGGPAALPLTGWSNAELCRAWRVTFAQLQQQRGAAWAAHLAEQRRTYLDELERRDPGGFAAWIGSGARAAGDPARYLTAAPRTP